MTHLIIVRGLPGSGKSTFAKEVVNAYPDFVHLETDDFFAGRNGRYKFHEKGLVFAINETNRQIELAMRKGSRIVVSSCYTRRSSYQNLLKLASWYGYTHEIITCEGAWKNTHGVPDDAVERMRANFEPTDHASGEVDAGSGHEEQPTQQRMAA